MAMAPLTRGMMRLVFRVYAERPDRPPPVPSAKTGIRLFSPHIAHVAMNVLTFQPKFVVEVCLALCFSRMNGLHRPPRGGGQARQNSIWATKCACDQFFIENCASHKYIDFAQYENISLGTPSLDLDRRETGGLFFMLSLLRRNGLCWDSPHAVWPLCNSRLN